MTILKCGKCGDTINEEGNHAFIDPFTKEERIGCVHDCSIIDDSQTPWLIPDFNDEYGIQSTKIWKNREKIPYIVDSKRCGVKVAQIEKDQIEGLDYYEIDSGKHFCIVDCRCGLKVFYAGPESNFAINLENHEAHRCPLEVPQ
jgi:hypothetical protein